jgi:hypothetical protein
MANKHFIKILKYVFIRAVTNDVNGSKKFLSFAPAQTSTRSSLLISQGALGNFSIRRIVIAVHITAKFFQRIGPGWV